MGDVTVIESGPLFDGRAGPILNRLRLGVEEKVAQRAVDMIKARLNAVIRVNHGIYVSTIHTERAMDGTVVTDRLVYGPWLEGVGSRNFPVTRFPGYHTFRIIGQQLQGEAGPIADEAAQPYIEELR